jgi:hypothetical protein
VFLASHASQFGMHQKRKPGDATIPTGSWTQGFRAAVDELEAIFKKQLAMERRQP